MEELEMQEVVDCCDELVEELAEDEPDVERALQLADAVRQSLAILLEKDEEDECEEEEEDEEDEDLDWDDDEEDEEGEE